MTDAIQLTRVSAEPGQSRYAALAAAWRARVIAGEWPPASALQAEQTLATHHGVALGTLRRALELMAEQCLIERIHGRGRCWLRLQRWRAAWRLHAATPTPFTTRSRSPEPQFPTRYPKLT